MGTHTLRDSLDKPVAVSGEWFAADSPGPFKGRHPTGPLCPTRWSPEVSDLLPTGAKGALGRGQDLWQPLGICFHLKQIPTAFIIGGGDALEMPSVLCTHF